MASSGGTRSPESLESLRARALGELKAAAGDGLEAWRTEYLGRRGSVTQVLRSISSVAVQDRARFGAAANALRNELEAAFEARAAAGGSRPAGLPDRIDVTLPGRRPLKGRLHPTTRTIRDIAAAFGAMGFQVIEGPEVEYDYYNFSALNIPHDHPARDMWDTLWIDQPAGHDGPGDRSKGGQQVLLRTDTSSVQTRILLRTHTSPMQARVMETTRPPIRVIVPGRCYRYEATDATHEWHFHQVEGLAVAEGITFADLKGTLYEFARRVFGVDRKVRFRCDYFPFVEPGVDMAIDWKGQWLEVMGAGMVHPKVLAGAGVDPEKYTGFAFGMGVERVAMLRHGIDDIRLFAGNDLRFLSQF